MMSKPQINTDEHRLSELTFAINGCAMDVLNKIGHGFHEKLYENAMVVALKNKNIQFSQQAKFDIKYQEEIVGTYIPDLIVENKIIVELKTIDSIGNHETGQVLNYLRACDLELGLILNFKHAKLQQKRVILTN